MEALKPLAWRESLLRKLLKTPKQPTPSLDVSEEEQGQEEFQQGLQGD